MYKILNKYNMCYLLCKCCDFRDSIALVYQVLTDHVLHLPVHELVGLGKCTIRIGQQLEGARVKLMKSTDLSKSTLSLARAMPAIKHSTNMAVIFKATLTLALDSDPGLHFFGNKSVLEN